MPNANIQDHLLFRHRLIRAGFVAQGTSLQAWCKQEGVKRQNAEKALKQTWKGPKAADLVTRILEAARVETL
jgi:lambda repressor-like predicted transcriptional regulator